MTLTNHSNPVVTFCKVLINSRGELLRRNVGNTTSPVLIKHEKVKKAFDYASSINTTDKGWANFLAIHEADLKHIMLGYGSKQRKSLEDKFNRAFYAAIQYKK
jgi:hypothetical protein